MKMPIGRYLLNAVYSARAYAMRKLLGESNCRDIDKECGHPVVLAIEDYEILFERGDIAGRVVELYPQETWMNDPCVYETEAPEETAFEKEWDSLCNRLFPFTYLQRADVLSGIGRFGVLFLGFGDGLELSMSVQGINASGEMVGSPKNTLLYLRAFDESYVKIHRLEEDPKNPRFGKPTSYMISFAKQEEETVGEKAQNVKEVHWTRVIHIADNRTNSELYGTPRMKRVFNRLLDLRKISGGSAEMFWKGGFPGLSIEAMPTIPGEEVEIDEEATQKQLEKYENGLQRYIALTGAQAKTLAPNIADPTAAITAQLKLIATALGCPWRVLIGSEQAQLASEQDTKAWNKRIARRQTTYIDPFVLRPFVDRLIHAGVLPKPVEYYIDWPNLNKAEGKDQSEIAKNQTECLSKYVAGGVDALVSPFHYLTLVLGLSDDEAEAIIAAVTQAAKEEDLFDSNGEQDDSNSTEPDDSNA